MPVPATILERLRLLEARDLELAAEAGGIEALTGRTADLRSRAAANLAALAALPGERQALAAAGRQAAERVTSARQALSEARAAVEAAARARRDREARVAEAAADARLAEERLADAERHVEQLAHRSEEIEERERALRAEGDELRGLVERLVSEVAATHRVAAPGVDRVPAALDDLDAWGVQARAALFVARGSVTAERDRLLVEANAVGSAVLGADVGALGVAQVIRLLEAAVA